MKILCLQVGTIDERVVSENPFVVKAYVGENQIQAERITKVIIYEIIRAKCQFSKMCFFVNMAFYADFNILLVISWRSFHLTGLSGYLIFREWLTANPT